MKNKYEEELIEIIEKLKDKYNADNIETANLLHGIAEHFAWYETHGKNNIND